MGCGLCIPPSIVLFTVLKVGGLKLQAWRVSGREAGLWAGSKAAGHKQWQVDQGLGCILGADVCWTAWVWQLRGMQSPATLGAQLVCKGWVRAGIPGPAGQLRCCLLNGAGVVMKCCVAQVGVCPFWRLGCSVLGGSRPGTMACMPARSRFLDLAGLVVKQHLVCRDRDQQLHCGPILGAVDLVRGWVGKLGTWEPEGPVGARLVPDLEVPRNWWMPDWGRSQGLCGHRSSCLSELRAKCPHTSSNLLACYSPPGHSLQATALTLLKRSPLCPASLPWAPPRRNAPGF